MNTELPAVQTVLTAAHWIAWSAPVLAVMILVGTGAWVCVSWRRRLKARAALVERAVVEVVPTSGFAPLEGEVHRWAHHLGRVTRSADRVPARGAAVRLRYCAETGSKMHCYIEGPAQAAAVLGMPGFDGVEVRTQRGRQRIEPVVFPWQRDRGRP
ncbi:hypothetical protein AB0M94_35505 [Streptomyces xanthochromogenes]|uniref:hypothetical protein n=1 Tax=Streptomyces xanthochromogenes TaxID=67384 RepID=UPI00343EA283